MTGEEFEQKRHALADRLQEKYGLSEAVTAAMKAVPREEFVPEQSRANAYVDRPLPIGDDQTISAPHMVAMMADQLALSEGEEVLEIGTGCGYHAAVTAELVGAENVYTVEYSETLADRAKKRLARLGYEGIAVRQGNGYHGWQAHAPYDAAYLTCGADAFPDAVVDQVRAGGRLLGPIGTGSQRLIEVEKRSDGSLDRTDHGGVRFVRMRGRP